ncbi:hypothetical protein BDV12DRAFT_176289 [Aspergillus spectabilis]
MADENRKLISDLSDEVKEDFSLFVSVDIPDSSSIRRQTWIFGSQSNRMMHPPVETRLSLTCWTPDILLLSWRTPGLKRSAFFCVPL